MSISKKIIINQFETFEKPRILILFGYGAWTWDMYEHVWNLDMGHGTCMNIYETYMGHGTFGHGAWTWDIYEHVWNLDMGHGTSMNIYETYMAHGTFGHGAWHVWNLDMGHGHGICMNMYETWTWDILTHGMGRGHVWKCMKLGHGTFEHGTWGVFVWFLL
jgi:hypothetical protein